jgi:hypothetical protein
MTSLIPPIPEASDPAAAAGLAKHLAATAHYRNALITASPDPAAPIAVAHRNASLAAVHFLRTLIYVTQHPDALRRETADQAAREVLAAWLQGEAGEWTWTHCTALGLDPDAIAATVRAEDPLRGPERALGGTGGAAAAQGEAPEALHAHMRPVGETEAGVPRLLKTVDAVAAELERLRLRVARETERAETAEVKLAKVRELAEEWTDGEIPDRWGDPTREALAAAEDGRAILAIIDDQPAVSAP